MTSSIKELIKNRKSVRTFNNIAISDEDLKKLQEYIDTLKNPFDADITFRLLDAKTYKLSSPVIVGEKAYLAAKVKKAGHFEIAYGYSFEKACLYALSLNIGTVMLAASLDRKSFEKAMDLQEDEVLPTASPIGYPADKRSVRESLMRKGLKADERMPFEELFYDGSFDRAITKDSAGEFREALEMLMLAPSATNRQPWRAVISGNKVHFYEYQTLKESELGDIQKVDVGAALAHFDMTMEENGYEGTFVFNDPGIAVPDKMAYIVTYERKA